MRQAVTAAVLAGALVVTGCGSAAYRAGTARPSGGTMATATIGTRGGDERRAGRGDVLGSAP